jgi:hypothetical protein
MSAPTRGRACNACHSLKIKCELGSKAGDAPCRRCIRLGKNCVVSPPRRQKDRVAELEAQVEALTRQLQVHSVDVKITPFEIDAIVSRSAQAQMLARYVDEMLPLSPFVPLRSDYDTLRELQPLLLQSVIYAASPGILSLDVQEDVMGAVSSSLASESRKSLELVQALQLAALWYRTPKYHTRVAVFHFIEQACAVAKEIGIGGANTSSITQHFKYDAIDSLRTWIICYLMSASISICQRTKNPISWGSHEEENLHMLESSTHGIGSDRMLCQFVRAERLCEQIASSQDVSDQSPDPVRQQQQPVNLMTDWRAQVPLTLRCESLAVWECFAAILLHEYVVQTPTNKQSFAAPYVPERLSVTDFPTPLVTPDRIVSIYALRDACHGLLDLFSGFDTQMLVSLPVLFYAARAAYAQWILVKLHIAATADGNTYGAVVDVQSLQVQRYLTKMIDVSGRISQIDAGCGPARIAGAARRLMEWLISYEASITFENRPVLDTYEPVALGDDENLDWINQYLGSDAFDDKLDGFVF